MKRLAAFGLAVLLAGAAVAQVFTKQARPPRERVTYYTIGDEGYVDIRCKIIDSTNDYVTLQLREADIGLLVDIGENWLVRLPIPEGDDDER